MRGLRKIFWLLVILIFAMGCQSKNKVIPRNELVKILVDVHLLDGAIQHAKYKDEIQVPDSIDMYDYVLEKHGYSQAQFDSSMSYYSRYPRKFEQIYQEVLSKLNRMETRVKEDQEKQREKERQELREQREAKEGEEVKPKELPKRYDRKPSELNPEVSGSSDR